MIKKHKYLKYLLVFFTVTFLFFLCASFSYALEIKPESYPRIPFTQPITENSDLPQYISYFFALGIYLAGALAVISLAIGGIQYIFSSVSPDSKNDAKERIIGAILGLVLTLSSFIILQTINPVLITPSLTPLGEVAGVFYTNGTEKKPAPFAEGDTDNIPPGFTSIVYKCAQGAYSPALLVWQFPQKNFGGVSDAFVERVTCEKSIVISGASSFKMAFETPGVYYFLKPGCAGFMSQTNLSNTQEIEEPFKSGMKSVKIINDIQSNIDYGVILHKEINFRGDCEYPFEAYQKESDCFDIASPMSSANIFIFNKDTWKTSGNGVVFYSKPFGYKTGANAGYYFVKPFNKLGETGEEIGEFWEGKPTRLDFSDSYNYVDVPEGERELCENFENCPGSIKVQGNYLVVLYAQQLQSENLYCQVFDKDVPNLKEEEVTAVQGRKLNLINIIPIK